MGFNAIRFIAGLPPRYQLDVCDEIGLMVYEENRASWCLEDSPRMAERFDHSTAAMIKRDRNHPCITMWGLLNETGQGAVFQHAVATLPLVRSLDASRVVMLNSGRFDLGGQSLAGLGSWNNSSFGPDPNVTFNTLSFAVSAPWATWPGKQLALHPGPNGEYTRGPLDCAGCRTVHDHCRVHRHRLVFDYRRPRLCRWEERGGQQSHPPRRQGIVQKGCDACRRLRRHVRRRSRHEWLRRRYDGIDSRHQDGQRRGLLAQ